MNFEMPNFSLALPEIAVLVMAPICLLAHIFWGDRCKNLAYYIVQATLLLVIGLCIYQFGGGQAVTFNGLYVKDDVAVLLKIFIAIAALGSFLYGRIYITDRDMPCGEYYVLGLFSCLGMMAMVSAQSLLVIFLALELMSLPIYAMIALRRESATAIEASMKYFVMGAIASGMLLYGMSMLYGATGSLQLDVIAHAIAAMPADSSLILSFAMVFIIAGLGFKLAAAPFHMWAPDVYTGAPSTVTMFLSSAPKVAAVGMTLRLLVVALPDLQAKWQELLIILAIFSLLAGNIIAIAQFNLKRMLAYSAISHIGFMLLGFISGTLQGYTAAMYYILIYVIMTLGGFSLIVLMSRAGFEAENIDDFRGLNARSPWLAFMVLIVMFSMAGIPPTVGFIAKFAVLNALVDAGFVLLALFALVMAVIGAFYYIRVVKVMYFDDAVDTQPIVLARDMNLTVSINGLSLLVLGIFPAALMSLCHSAMLTLV